MVVYVHYFFGCRSCAKDFSKKVAALKFLPSSARESLLWIWQIHNSINKELIGT